jgi:hypothetical protein
VVPLLQLSLLLLLLGCQRGHMADVGQLSQQLGQHALTSGVKVDCTACTNMVRAAGAVLLLCGGVVVAVRGVVMLAGQYCSIGCMLRMMQEASGLLAQLLQQKVADISKTGTTGVSW